MGISRGRPSRNAPYFRIWPRRWGGQKTFLRVIDLDTAADENWFQTHYAPDAGGTVICLGDDCHYCARHLKHETRLYCPAVLYVMGERGVQHPGPLVLLELYPTAGADLERVYKPGILVTLEKRDGRTVIEVAGQSSLPPCPRPFNVLHAMVRLGMLPESAVEAEERSADVDVVGEQSDEAEAREQV